jgi:hypothetical protein
MKDLDETKAPLMEHLIELRRRLLWCLAALAAAFFACLYFARDIFAVLVQPLLNAGQGKLIYTDIFEAFLRRGEGGPVRRGDAHFPGDRNAIVEVRRARPLCQGKRRLSCRS